MYYWTPFLLGLFGSVHCAGMCGPLGMALPATGGGTLNFTASRAAYNLGRILTYCGLGAMFGALGQSLAFAGVQRWVSIVLGLVLLGGLMSSRTLSNWPPLIALVNRLKTQMAGVLRRRTFASMAVLGMLNGLLPCGLVYVAAAGATTTGTIQNGAAHMAAFGLGTLPMMLAISLSGRLFPLSFRLKLARAIPASVFIVAVLLILRGLELGIPYVSPQLGVDSCCHP
ncbi:MAG TPA: sulfite exporter TauE/SafE family protein [Verrucomicrobiae bacterium]|nr:sulfite exporter TauE/SafE family protein [Verrucomicrobiae bacterium]